MQATTGTAVLHLSIQIFFAAIPGATASCCSCTREHTHTLVAEGFAGKGHFKLLPPSAWVNHFAGIPHDLPVLTGGRIFDRSQLTAKTGISLACFLSQQRAWLACCFKVVATSAAQP